MKSGKVATVLDNIFDQYFYQEINTANHGIISFLDEFQKINNQLIDTLEHAKRDPYKVFNAAKDYQQWKLEGINLKYTQLNVPFYPLEIDRLKTEIENFLKTIPKKKVNLQSESRFHASAGDHLSIKLAKQFKFLFYKISILPLKTANLVRKVFKKEIKKIRYWKYTIPYRKLVSYQIETILLDQISSVVNNYISKNIEVLKDVIDKEQQINDQVLQNTLESLIPEFNTGELKIDFDKSYKLLAENGTQFKNEIKELFAQSDLSLNELSTIAGTIEYPEVYLNFQNRKYKRNQVLRKLNSINLGWGNTVFGLFEDWKLDQEIYNLNYFSTIKINELGIEYHSNNDEVKILLQQVKTRVSVLNEHLQHRLLENKAKEADLIQEELDVLSSSISRDNLSDAIEKLISQNLPEGINLFEIKIVRFLKEISEKRWLTKLTEYNKIIKSSDLNSFSPRELISFEYLPQLEESLFLQKSKIVRFVEEIKEDINNIEHVVAFNLSSIIESIEKGECDKHDIPRLIAEGLDRGQNKIEEILDSITTFEEETIHELKEIVKQFNTSTLKLTVNENAFNLRIIVMKAKAIKKSEEISGKLWDKAKTLYQKGITIGSGKIQKLEQIILPWKRRIGLDEAQKGIATELSDFLQEVSQKINNLPIIYQRLYKITPLAEMSLFTGRKIELEMLEKAYTSWKEGKYSPTVIIGEKWSGHTTLINFFIDKYLTKKDVIYENRVINIKDEDEFYTAWENILSEKKLNSIDNIAAIIAKKYKGRVFILENIQNYYLRTIKGFENLNLLIKLIAKTYKEVFWLFSVNIYAWDYLNKTIDLSGYFGYEIKMNPFSDEELRELIMKKNNISGYKIIFTPSENNENNKKFTRLNEEEKQAYLRKQFFNELNSFAKGNISLALTYWLLSTKKITEEAIEITNFISPDFSFISNLNSEKAFIIYLLIMHDGLTLDHLGEVFKKPMDKLHLIVIMLLDDGILIERDNWFEVNPLIYRHSINMLKSRNLIY